MADEKARIELYTCKWETVVVQQSAKLAVTISATRGTVEDVNLALQRAVDALRATFPEADPNA